jgi:integrase
MKMARPRLDGTPSRTPDRRALSDLVVKRIEPRDRPFTIWDARAHNLVILVQPSGHKAYKVIYRRSRRSCWYHIGDVRDVPLKDARQTAARVMLAVADGKDPAADRKAQRTAGTFEELAARYLNEHAKVKNKSWKQGDSLTRRHLVPKWGKLPAAQITRDDVEGMFARIEAPILANQVLASASAIFSWAVKKQVSGVLVNPCHGVDRHPTESRERILEDHELPIFWQALDTVDPIRGAALRLILLTGQRPGEVAHMRKEHLAANWWTMPGKPVPEMGWPGTKNKATHRVWVPQVAMAFLPDVERGFVFGRVLHDLDGAMREVCAKAGLPRTTPHDLRRSHGSTITGMGFGRPAMNRIQNHREGGIGDVYDRHDYSKEIQTVMEAVAARIVALANGEFGMDNVLPLRAG